MTRIILALLLFFISNVATAAIQICTTASYNADMCAGDAQALCTKLNLGTAIPFGDGSDPQYGRCSGNAYINYAPRTAPEPCVLPEVWRNDLHACGLPPPPECAEGEHAVGQECQPDNCPSGQAWNPEKNSCYPTSPPPTPDGYAPPGYYPVGTCTGPFGPDAICTLNTGYTPANCDGWACNSIPQDIVPESEGGGCYQYESSPELLHCLVRPRYDAERCTDGPLCAPLPSLPPDDPRKFQPKPVSGPPAEPDTPPPDPTNPPPTYNPPPPAYVPPPESTTPPPALVCPVGTTRDATTGICYAPAPTPTPSTHTDPGGTPSPTPATCPAGYTLTSTGQCTAPAQPGPGGTTPGCPPGYTLDGTTCRSVGTIDPRNGQGLPGPSSSGTGTGTGSACGAPGQPVCAIDWGTGEGLPGFGASVFQLPEFTFDLESMTLIEVGPTNATCPADVALPQGITWSWTATCSFAEWMRPIFVGMAWLSAGFIVLGGLPRG